MTDYNKTRDKKKTNSKKYVSIPQINSDKGHIDINKGRNNSALKSDNEQNIYASIRKNIMEDKEFKYVYGMHGNVVHDKNCYLVKKIPDQEFKYLRNYPLWLKQCPKCAANAYIRNGAIDFEKIKEYRELFTMMKVGNDMLRHIYIDCGMKTRIYRNTLTVYYNEDTWKITYLDSPGRVRLYHNNYHVENGKRIFEKSFHIQSDFTSNTTAKFAFENIETYSWDMHRVNASEIVDHGNSKYAGRNKVKSFGIKSLILSLLGNKNSSEKNKRDAADNEDTEPLDFELDFSDFNLVKEYGYPEDGMRCIYIWKTKNNIYQWQIGEYKARKGRFVIKFDEQEFITDRNKVVAWKYVWKGKLSVTEDEKGK